MAASLLYPFWIRIAQLSGKPHFFSVLNSGLNPFQKITPESKAGQEAELEKSQRLGGGWQWRTSTESYRNQKNLIDIAVERDKKIRSLSRIITYYALSGENFTSSSLLSGLAPLNLRGSLEKIHADKNKVADFIWVSQKLSRIISQSNRIDINKPIFALDPEILNEYYQASLDLVEKSKDRSFLSRRVGVLYDTFLKNIRKGLFWNMEKADLLSKYTPSSDVANLFWTPIGYGSYYFSDFSVNPNDP